jgi:predicted nucleotidyltransferase
VFEIDSDIFYTNSSSALHTITRAIVRNCEQLHGFYDELEYSCGFGNFEIEAEIGYTVIKRSGFMGNVTVPVSSALLDMAESLRQKYDIDEIILFGSQAYGKPDKDSDFDLLIIMNSADFDRNKAAEIRQYLYEEFGTPFPIDIIVRTSEQIEKRIQAKDYFIKEIVEKGIQL